MKDQIRTPLTTRRTHRFGCVLLRLYLLLAVALLAVTPFADGQEKPSGQSAGAGPSRFAIASIRRNTTPEAADNFQCTSDGLVATRFPLKLLIEFAFRLREYQLSGGPPWIESDPYDVRAKVDDSDLDAFKTGGRTVCLTMLQNLLADRFHLVVHHRTSQLPAYELVVAKGGPRLSLAAPGGDLNDTRAMAGVIDAKVPTMSFLARILSGNVGVPVMDKTNLSGTYAVVLHWTPPVPNVANSPGADLEEDPGGATESIFSALQDQLGLQLRPTNAPTDLIVVDHAERPTGN